MDHYSILDPGFSESQSRMPNPAQIGLPREIAQGLPKIDALQLRAEVQVREEPASARMRPPREENAGSLADIALSDLDAILQLLAERAEYITHATGAAIALWEGEEMVCRASAGPSAPAVGARLQVESGLSGESVRTRKALRCDDAETDSRVNRESCRALGIASVVVLPLVREQKVRGLFELFSDQAYAFATRDLEALERLGEMVDTALQHADAAHVKPGVLEAVAIAKRMESQTVRATGWPANAQAAEESEAASSSFVSPVVTQNASGTNHVQGLRAQPEIQPSVAVPPPANLNSADDVVPALLPRKVHPLSALTEDLVSIPQSKPPVTSELANIHKCQTCGFPVSEGRKLCLDCEARLLQTQPATGRGNGERGQQLSPGNAVKRRKQLWIVENGYMVTAIVLFVMVLIALVLSHSS